MTLAITNTPAHWIDALAAFLKGENALHAFVSSGKGKQQKLISFMSHRHAVHPSDRR